MRDKNKANLNKEGRAGRRQPDCDQIPISGENSRTDEHSETGLAHLALPVVSEELRDLHHNYQEDYIAQEHSSLSMVLPKCQGTTQCCLFVPTHPRTRLERKKKKIHQNDLTRARFELAPFRTG